MKKVHLYFFSACAMALAIASCQRNEEVINQADSAVNDGVIAFSAYVNTSVTKGTVESIATIKGSTTGIGVFSFYQPAVSGVSTYFNTRKFAAPDFMYNQQVTTTDGANWTYSPIKYWPNNPGDLLSFFAYAPYNEDKTWDELGIVTDAVGSKLSVNFSIADDYKMQEDQLWADPLINQTNKDEDNVNQLNHKLKFNFKHITSKVDIYLGVAEPDNTIAGAWTDEDTKIIVENITFGGLYDGFKYVYTISEGKITSTPTPDAKNASKFDMIITPNDLCDTIDNSWNPANGYEKYLETATSGEGHYMFLAPQTFNNDEEVSITYTVMTDDEDKNNASTITNVIKKNMGDILPDGKFEAGKAYKLKFLIGMDDVNISAVIADWEDAEEIDPIDVPANYIDLPSFETADGWVVSDVEPLFKDWPIEDQSLKQWQFVPGDTIQFKLTNTDLTTVDTLDFDLYKNNQVAKIDTANGDGSFYFEISSDTAIVKYVVNDVDVAKGTRLTSFYVKNRTFSIGFRLKSGVTLLSMADTTVTGQRGDAVKVIAEYSGPSFVADSLKLNNKKWSLVQGASFTKNNENIIIEYELPLTGNFASAFEINYAE